MNCPEEIASKDRKRLEDTEDRRNRQRLKAVEELLLQEFDQAWAELDRAKANPGVSPEVKKTCRQYLSTIQRMRRLLQNREIPPDLASKVTCITTGRPDPLKPL
jgi:hypothetical protein